MLYNVRSSRIYDQFVFLESLEFSGKFRMRIVKFSGCSWGLDFSCGFSRHLHSLAAEFPADFFELPADSHALHGMQALGFKAGRRRFGLAPWDVWNWHVFDSPFRQKSIGLVLFFMWYLACSCIAYHAFLIFFFHIQKLITQKIHIQNSWFFFICSSSCPLFFGDF